MLLLTKKTCRRINKMNRMEKILSELTSKYEAILHKKLILMLTCSKKKYRFFRKNEG